MRKPPPLRETATGFLDNTGAIQLRVGPLSAREIWYPASVSVSVNAGPGGVVNEAVCYIYAGPTADQSYFRDATRSASTGDSTDRVSADVIKVGNYIWGVWSGGDPGKQAVLTVIGEKSV